MERRNVENIASARGPLSYGRSKHALPKRTLACALVGASALAANGCQRAETGGSAAGVYQLRHLWPTAEAYVCFNTTRQGYSYARSETKRIVEEQFNKRTNFRFRGFDICSAQQKRDLRIDFGDFRRSNAGAIGTGANLLLHYGPGAALARPPMQLNVEWNDEVVECRQSRAVCLHNLIVHEFGHAAGLVHEHARSDNSLGQFCDGTQFGASPSEMGSSDFGYGNVTVGFFDPSSIMNYCRENYWSRILGLSPGDIETLHAAYPAPGRSVARTGPSPAQEAQRLGCHFNNALQGAWMGCATFVAWRAHVRNVLAPHGLSANDLSKAVRECVARNGRNQLSTCTRIVLTHVSTEWPNDGFRCLASGSGYNCIRPSAPTQRRAPSTGSPTAARSPGPSPSVDPVSVARDMGCTSHNAMQGSWPGCVSFVGWRARATGRPLAPGLDSTDLYNAVQGCTRDAGSSQFATCTNRVLNCVSAQWPSDDFACLANGGGASCLDLCN